MGNVDGFDPVKYTEQGKRFQQVLITDGNGEQQKVKIYLAKGPEMTATGNMSFQIGPNPYQNQMYYSGFWNPQANSQQNAQPAQPQGPQPQATAGATNAKKTNDGRDYDKEGHIICFCALVKAMIQKGTDPVALNSDLLTLGALANLATKCINSYDYRAEKPKDAGEKIPPNMNPKAADNMPIDDDIPF